MRPAAAAVYPFSAIVAQDEMKLAMVLNVVDPRIGGVLVMGHRGTGKSTAVRALGDLLPEISIVSGCAYRCDPTDEQNCCDECRKAIAADVKLKQEKSAVQVVDLPLGATEDRVCGTIDIEQALRSGVKRFEPGLLARANRGFLYIDEVNLLEDHLVDLLLDVATTGINKVEREGISVKHPARFVLVGSGNPEEGELRPQLLDRFGLFVEVKTEDDVSLRMEIVERREAFDEDTETFDRKFATSQEQLQRDISRARKSHGKVGLEPRLLGAIAGLCSELKIDGHRGEITIARASRALAALEGRKKVNESDVRRVAVMALRHRLRRNALEEVGSAQRIENALNKLLGGARNTSGAKDDGDGDDSSSNGEYADRKHPRSDSPSSRPKAVGHNGNAKSVGSPSSDAGGESPTSSEFKPPAFKSGTTKINASDLRSQLVKVDSKTKDGRGSGAKRTVYSRQQGRYTRAVNSRVSAARIALDATLRAGAVVRSRSCATTPVPADALRFKLFKRKQGRLFIFAIDLSGSMALNRINHARDAMLGLLRQSYVYRDSVAIVGFRGTGAEVMLPPARSILRARRVLASLPVGGGTPLSAGLMCALDLGKRVDQTAGARTLLIFTDGGANVPLGARAITGRADRQSLIETEVRLIGGELRKAGVDLVMVDTKSALTPGANAQGLAETLGAKYVDLQPAGVARKT